MTLTLHYVFDCKSEVIKNLTHSGRALVCLLSLPRASVILSGTQASYICLAARWSGQI